LRAKHFTLGICRRVDGEAARELAKCGQCQDTLVEPEGGQTQAVGAASQVDHRVHMTGQGQGAGGLVAAWFGRMVHAAQAAMDIGPGDRLDAERRVDAACVQIMVAFDDQALQVRVMLAPV
jgi:hypothetical protein